MRTIFIILSITLCLSSCADVDSGGGILTPQQASQPGAPPTTVPGTPVLPVPPVPVTPSLTVTVKQIINGNPVFSGPQDAWHVVLEYDYVPDPNYPCVWVETYYVWDGMFRRNIKIWDCVANPGPITDDFYDYAWGAQLIEYSIKIFTCSVTNADWFNGFCMGDPSDYWGTVDPNWLYCPIDGAHPNGLRVASGLVLHRSPMPQINKFIRVLGYYQPVVQ